MARGGARNRSGPPPDPKSERSERLGRRFGRLPRGGYTGRLPAWPLTLKATAAEREVWRQVWRTPQASAWISEPWRHPAVALYCRYRVRMEQPDAPAALGATVIRLADQIGLTPAGLRENGWELEEVPGSRARAEEASKPSVGPGSEGEQAPTPPAGGVPLRERLKVVSNGTDV